jgi:type IV pilus assembly protein PilP
MQVIASKPLLLVPVLLAAELFLPLPSLAAVEFPDVAAAAGGEAGQPKAEDADNFEYQLENRPDPFYPFVTKEDKQKQADEELIEEAGEVLSEMQLIEPGQLKLAAVLHVEGRYIAMAEKATGEGAILREGMLIGRRGQIVRIEEGRVIVKETYKTTSGKEKTNEIVMNLKKEGDK